MKEFWVPYIRKQFKELKKPFEVKCLQWTETCPVAYNIANYYDLDDWEYSPTLWRKVHCRKYSSVTEFSVSHSDYQLLRVNPNPIIPKVVCHCFVVFDHLLFGIYQDNLCVEIISHQWHQNYISSSKKKNQTNKKLLSHDHRLWQLKKNWYGICIKKKKEKTWISPKQKTVLK